MSRPMSPDERHMRARLTELQYLKRRVEGEITLLQRRLQRRGERAIRNKELKHGTESGYHWHRRKGVPFPEDDGGVPCGCRRAHAKYEAMRSRVRRASEVLGE